MGNEERTRREIKLKMHAMEYYTCGELVHNIGSLSHHFLHLCDFGNL